MSSSSMRKIIISLALVATTTTGFIAPAPNQAFNRELTKVNNVGDPTGFDSFSKAKDVVLMKNLPLGEAQRPFRRTVYTHDDWKKHRSQDRFFYYLLAIFKSGVYKNLGREVGTVTALSVLLVIFNGLNGGFTDLAGVEHAALLPFGKVGIPLAAFTLTSPSLGLLLVFRTNTSYQRWDEARKNWGMNINHTRDLVRLSNALYDSKGISPEERQDDLNHVALCTWAFVRSMKRHLSPEDEDENAFKIELYEKLPRVQAEMIINAAHRPNRALQDLSYAIEDLPMHYLRKNEIHKAVTIFEDNLGSSERILTSPVPLFYSRHLARYLGVWLLLLPLGIYDSFGSSWNHLGMIPAMAVISTFLFGIEEIGTQLEEPFTVLPMQAFCDKIYNWCMEIMTWQPGDNGREMKAVKREHQYFTAADNAAAPAPVMNYAPPAPAPVMNYAPPAPSAPTTESNPPEEAPSPTTSSTVTISTTGQTMTSEELSAQWAAASLNKRL